MTRPVYLFIIAAFCVITGCATTHHTPSFSVIAWNEDTTNSYQLAFTKKGSFYYSIKTKNGVERYKGAYGETESDIYLKYTDNPPTGFVPYLIKEISGNYYIQNFTDGRKRIFLRIRKPHFTY